MKTLKEAEDDLAQVRAEFYELCEQGRKTFVTTREMSVNLMKYQAASEAVWEAMFAGIADTGVKISKS